MVVFPIPFHIFMPLANLWLIRFQGQFFILRKRSSPNFYPLIRPPKSSLALCAGRFLIRGFVWSPPMLAFYDISHSLPRAGVGRGFPFIEDETRRHFSYLCYYYRCENKNPCLGRSICPQAVRYKDVLVAMHPSAAINSLNHQVFNGRFKACY